jgi:GxxExxY protein
VHRCRRRFHHEGTEDTEEERKPGEFRDGETALIEERLKASSAGLVEAELTRTIIGAAMCVHRELGPGLLESAYQAAMCRELSLQKVPFKCELDIPVEYKGVRLDCGYRVDLLVDDRVLVELKSVERVLAVHEAQLITYLRLSGMRVGLLINFNVPSLRRGILRRVL